MEIYHRSQEFSCMWVNKPLYVFEKYVKVVLVCVPDETSSAALSTHNVCSRETIQSAHTQLL